DVPSFPTRRSSDLRRFRVLAARELARGFSRQHGITHFTENSSASRLTLTRGTDLPTPRATRLPPDNHRRVELPHCVTPSLTYYPPGSHASTSNHPKAAASPGGGSHQEIRNWT